MVARLDISCDKREMREQMEKHFPELKESEDEKIRKELITHCRNTRCVTEEGAERIAKWIAWLEKQGESYTKRDVDDAYLKGVTDTKNETEKQYEANYQIRKDIATFIFNYRGDIKDRAKWMDYLGIKVSFIEKQGEQKPEGKTALEAAKEEKVDNQNCVKPAVKVKPKFHKGDWVVSPNGIYWHIDAIQNGRYEVTADTGQCSNCWSLDTNIYRLWTIQDAKDGDVLVDEDTNVIGIFEGIEGMCWHSKLYYSCYTKELYGIECGGFHLKEFAKPAAKEQRDTLFKAMADAGYTFDFKKKELKKIEQKPAWSEEDDYNLQCCIAKIQYDIDNGRIGRNRELLTWLKSLRPQNRWKPSDEQMLAINTAINVLGKGTLNGKQLIELREELQKLREE